MTIKAFTASFAFAGFMVAAPSILGLAGAAVQAEPAPTTVSQDQKPAVAPAPTVTVVPGDTLSNIAAAHQTTYVRIYNANDKIQHPDVIRPGEVYRIPAAEETLPERSLPDGATSVPAASPAAAAKPRAVAPAAAARPSMNVAANKQALMAQAGIAAADFGYADHIISKESGWNATIANKKSGAYGLCQALPGKKMATAGGDWADNPVTQLRWCNNYAVSRYGGWANAYNTWQSKKWW